MFSKSVKSESITCARTSAIINSAITSRNCSTARTAVAHEAGGLVVPLLAEEVDGILQRPRNAVVVFGSDEDVGIERADLLGPPFRVRFAILPHTRRQRLVKQREVVVKYVDQFEYCLAAFLSDAVYLARNRDVVPVRTRAAGNNSNSQLALSHVTSHRLPPFPRQRLHGRFQPCSLRPLSHRLLRPRHSGQAHHRET